jgi:hypothetical protein
MELSPSRTPLTVARPHNLRSLGSLDRLEKFGFGMIIHEAHVITGVIVLGGDHRVKPPGTHQLIYHPHNFMSASDGQSATWTKIILHINNQKYPHSSSVKPLLS